MGIWALLFRTISITAAAPGAQIELSSSPITTSLVLRTADANTQLHWVLYPPMCDAVAQSRVCRPVSPTAPPSLPLPLRADWEQVKDGIMYRAVWQKFSTHADIREILLGTGEALLVENSPVDYYWGCGQDGSGQNQLGQILMGVREQLRSAM